MAPINDEDIDPQLHALDEDPSMQFFACRPPQPASSHDDPTSEPEGPSDDFRAHSPAFQDFPIFRVMKICRNPRPTISTHFRR